MKINDIESCNLPVFSCPVRIYIFEDHQASGFGMTVHKVFTGILSQVKILSEKTEHKGCM